MLTKKIRQKDRKFPIENGYLIIKLDLGITFSWLNAAS